MKTYDEFELTESDIKRLKINNAKQKIRAFIKKNGIEPNDTNSFYTVTNEELERHRMSLYSYYLAKGKFSEVDVESLSGLTSANTQDNETLQENEDDEVDYSKQYLTFNILSGGTIVWKTENEQIAKTISYSKDGGKTWTEITSSSAGTSFDVSKGDKVLFKGENATYGGNLTKDYNTFGVGGSSAYFHIEGNIMSLVDGDNFANSTFLNERNTFYRLFRTANVVDAKNLILPATGLTYGCYKEMFSHCASLVIAPKLPAMTMVNTCYGDMFAGCTSLTKAPELPATTLDLFCYIAMFMGCTSLTKAPELPATILADYCYHSMFRGCENLNYIKALFTTIPSIQCTTDWLNGVAENGTFVKNSNATWNVSGNNGIPNGWTVITESPV